MNDLENARRIDTGVFALQRKLDAVTVLL